MTTKPQYLLKLHKTYYDKGFFNLGVDVERFVTPDDGPIQICLGKGRSEIQGRVDRSVNPNNTPRIFGGTELRNWIQRNFEMNDTVTVTIESPKRIWIGPNTGINAPNKTKVVVAQNVSNAHAGSRFENVAVEVLAKSGVLVKRDFPVSVGIAKTKKPHRFDLGSESPPILVECKSHCWTTGGNVPSAKMTIWNEAMYYFAIAPDKYRKIFFVLRDVRENGGETLSQYYVRTYSHLIPKDVEIWEYDSATGEVNVVGPP